MHNDVISNTLQQRTTLESTIKTMQEDHDRETEQNQFRLKELENENKKLEDVLMR